MKGSEYIAKFLKAVGGNQVFLVQGGAISFMVDAIYRESDIDFVCFQHEQAAAMAADALWRTNGQLGVTMATSGPGASNLVTGIACGYYDSIPSLHITGQVNHNEFLQYRGAPVRQAGFQQMDIVDMVAPVCKYAVSVTTHEEMRRALKRAVEEAFGDRMGPVLVDIPMNLQNEEMQDSQLLLPNLSRLPSTKVNAVAARITSFLATAKRPLVIYGGGVGLAGQQTSLNQWLKDKSMPFVATWAALNYFSHSETNYVGHFGVYGNRGGNFAVQNADRILVLGSRLDNRQRSGNPANFAPHAKILCVDLDQAELDKLDPARYDTLKFDLRDLGEALENITVPDTNSDWIEYLQDLKGRYFNRDTSAYSRDHGTLSPYRAVQKLLDLADGDAVITTDAGANHCWVYQSFYRDRDQLLMTSSGHYAMGYALPASIGAALVEPQRQHICCNGDGGLQMNIQEMQTASQMGLDIKIVIFNNKGLAMIKQFQDTYMGGRYAATDQGPGRPDFSALARAYDFDYAEVRTLEDITADLLKPGRRVIEIWIEPGCTIEPKLEMGRPINDQMPYVTDQEFQQGNRFVEYKRIK